MYFIIAALLLLMLFGPQLWVRHVLAKYGKPRDDYPGTGGEFAAHLLKQFDLQQVKVEATVKGDHYDPAAKAVRLTEDKLNGKSLTAVTVAAHEVGHALQDHLGYAPLLWRTRLVRLAQKAEKTGSGVMLVLPVVAVITRSPAAGVAMFFLGLASMAVTVAVHLITLPVEWDASFGRALPLLRAGNYISGKDEKAATRILTACAFTYFVSSLASLLNVWRWLRLWRR